MLQRQNRVWAPSINYAACLVVSSSMLSHMSLRGWARPLAFAAGAVMLLVGDAIHIWMWASAPGYETASNMQWDPLMVFAMVIVTLGTVALIWALLPVGAQDARFSSMEQAAAQQLSVAEQDPALARALAANPTAVLRCLDTAPFSWLHVRLCVLLTLGVVIDVMKPSSLGFVLPGMKAVYSLSALQASAFPAVALSGTAVGSLLWGAAGDHWGRRPAMLAASVLFVATTACGAMPSFNWNLAMCAFMGLSAGGFLPIVFALLCELAPVRYRGLTMVVVGGIGTAGGTAVASGAASVLIPLTSWRILWMLNTPTGLLLMLLLLGVPESPRFLVESGRVGEAMAIMRTLVPAEELRRAAQAAMLSAAEAATAAQTEGDAAATADADALLGGVCPSPLATAAVEAAAPAAVAAPAAPPPKAGAGAEAAPSPRQTRRFGCEAWGTHTSLVASLCALSFAYGLTANGFSLWLPTTLKAHGVSADALLAYSALVALAAVPIAAAGYFWVSSRGSLIAAAIGMWVVIAAFAAGGIGLTDGGASAHNGLFTLLVALSLFSTTTTAILSAYSAEVFSTRMRARGAGLVAASAKLAGVAGPTAVAAAAGWEPLRGPALLVGCVLTLAVVLVAAFTVETRGLGMKEVEEAAAGGGRNTGAASAQRA